jgi:putative hydrolase of the HAD superfamily
VGLSVLPDLVVLDFDGTLAYRPGLWSQCMLEVLDQHRPGHEIAVEDLRPHLRDGFPWHCPDTAHPELNEPEAWWQSIGDLLNRAYAAVGVAVDDELRGAVREHYCDPTRFPLYDDTYPALELLASAGVRTTILSNHVPELDSIVAHHGLDALVDEVITSARLASRSPTRMPSGPHSATSAPTGRG